MCDIRLGHPNRVRENVGFPGHYVHTDFISAIDCPSIVCRSSIDEQNMMSQRTTISRGSVRCASASLMSPILNRQRRTFDREAVQLKRLPCQGWAPRLTWSGGNFCHRVSAPVATRRTARPGPNGMVASSGVPAVRKLMIVCARALPFLCPSIQKSQPVVCTRQQRTLGSDESQHSSCRREPAFTETLPAAPENVRLPEVTVVISRGFSEKRNAISALTETFSEPSAGIGVRDNRRIGAHLILLCLDDGPERGRREDFSKIDCSTVTVGSAPPSPLGRSVPVWSWRAICRVAEEPVPARLLGVSQLSRVQRLVIMPQRPPRSGYDRRWAGV